MGDMSTGFLETGVLYFGTDVSKVLLCALGSVTVHSHCIITFNYLARVLSPFPLIVNVYKGKIFSYVSQRLEETRKE